MRITIKLFASFRQDRFKVATRDIAVGTRIADIIADLGIELAEVGMIFIDGRHAEPTHALADGETLSLFPLLGGG